MLNSTVLESCSGLDVVYQFYSPTRPLLYNENESCMKYIRDNPEEERSK